MSRIDLPNSIHKLIGKTSVEVMAPTVGAALEKLGQNEPLIKKAILTESGVLQNFVVAFVNGKDIRMVKGLDTPLKSEDIITLYMAVAGG